MKRENVVHGAREKERPRDTQPCKRGRGFLSRWLINLQDTGLLFVPDTHPIFLLSHFENAVSVLAAWTVTKQLKSAQKPPG